MENILELKTINELQEYKFYIPSYQRGYRWSIKEVKDLLNYNNGFMVLPEKALRSRIRKFCLFQNISFLD